MPSNKSMRKKRGKVSTSFRKEKVTPVVSGKKFKKTKKMQKKMRKSICDSTFSMSYLSPSNVSTPLGLRGTVGKRKAGRISVGDNSALLSGVLEDTGGNVKDDIDLEEKEDPPSKQAKICPQNDGIALKDIGDMFRNDHNLVMEGIINNPPPVSETVMGEKADDLSIIVIEDDNDSDDVPTSAVEELGQELMKVVEEPHVNVPDTPRTIIRNRKLDNIETVKDNDTIVLDDTGDNDEIIIIENDDWPPLPAPLQSGSMQDVMTRYPSKAPDFIPLGRGTRGCRGRGKNRRGRGGRGGGHAMTAEKPPVFTIGVPNTQFSDSAGSSKSKVFRFTGSKGGKEKEGPTMFVGQQQDKVEGGLRPIVIDGSNVAMSHGLGNLFSSRGIELVVKYFTARGHKKVVAFVPQFRNKHNMSTDRELLEQLYKAGNLVYTPSREVDGARISSYDDAFILDYAAMHGGVVITRDNYRDLAHDKQQWLEVVKNRILMPTFIGDDVMFPSDPLGRNGPNLDKFLRF